MRSVLLIAALALSAAPAFAQTAPVQTTPAQTTPTQTTLVDATGNRPPANALSLSELTQRIESTFTDFAAFDEIEWDDDGYWEVKMWTTSGAEVKGHADPFTGSITPK